VGQDHRIRTGFAGLKQDHRIGTGLQDRIMNN